MRDPAWLLAAAERRRDEGSDAPLTLTLGEQIELLEQLVTAAVPTLCSQCGEQLSAMVKIGTTDGWCTTCLNEAADSEEPTGE